MATFNTKNTTGGDEATITAYGYEPTNAAYGYEPTQLPELTGVAGKSWFKRWRHRFDVKFRQTVKHLKVP